MEQEQRNKEYPGIDLCKFVMSFIIVWFHCGIQTCFAGQPAERWIFFLRDISLAFFFCANGFFLFRELDLKENAEDRKRFWKRWRGNVRLYLTWVLIYMPLMLYGEFVVYDSSVWVGSLKIIRAVFLTGWHYYSWSLWYLLAMLVSTAIVALLSMYGQKTWKIVCLAFVLYLAGFTMDWMRAEGVQNDLLEIYYKIFYTTRGGVFWGMAFVAYGFWSRRQKAEKHAWFRAAAVLSLIVMLVLFQRRSGNGMLANCVLVYGVGCVLFEVCRTLSLPDSALWKYMRGMSRSLYFIHMLFLALFQFVFGSAEGFDWRTTICVTISSAAYGVVHEIRGALKEKKAVSADRIV